MENKMKEHVQELIEMTKRELNNSGLSPQKKEMISKDIQQLEKKIINFIDNPTGDIIEDQVLEINRIFSGVLINNKVCEVYEKEKKVFTNGLQDILEYFEKSIEIGNRDDVRKELDKADELVFKINLSIRK